MDTISHKHPVIRVTVVGGGRMGLPLAGVLAGNGATVTVCDNNPDVVDAVATGHCPYEEPDLADLIEHACRTGKLTATMDTAEAVASSDVVIVIVPAHLTSLRDIDYATLKAASDDIGRGLTPGTLVCYETTVAVGGTRENLVPVLENASRLVAGRDFSVAFSPERVKANNVIDALTQTAKVVGGLDEGSAARAVAFYRRYLGAPVENVGPLEAAEFCKLAGMLYRDVNIALSNELAAFAERLGVDYERVRAVANTDGEAKLLEAGIGVGGHCTPVYPYFFTQHSRRLGLAQRLCESAREINESQPERHVRRLAQLWGPLCGRHVHILGLGFRPQVKVSTLSPAYALRDHLKMHGAEVSIEDPLYKDEELAQAGFAVARAGFDPLHAVILNTAHQAFLTAPFRQWRESGIEVVVDGRRAWNPEKVRQEGLIYIGVGHALLRPENSLVQQSVITSR